MILIYLCLLFALELKDLITVIQLFERTGKAKHHLISVVFYEQYKRQLIIFRYLLELLNTHEKVRVEYILIHTYK